MNIIIPISIGSVIYYLFSPQVMFVKIIDDILKINFHIIEPIDNLLFKFIRYYLLDMLWGYALVFALYLILGNNTAKLWKILFIAFSFSAVIEFFQLASFFDGTFDIFDIVVEFVAELFAVLIINYLKFRRKTIWERH